ncbi:hypothetical protein HPP92_001633 [Vanilla planifolia]|uniref:Uncharacterized protein n=1 Tax=Vanilla planifolia TaxID=51239 RepID=A0A835VFI9_VANPL|nr:hypothetical protein HPP92_001633 [Vanilla planifolia]
MNAQEIVFALVLQAQPRLAVFVLEDVRRCYSIHYSLARREQAAKTISEAANMKRSSIITSVKEEVAKLRIP